jgi:hypothetical protein
LNIALTEEWVAYYQGQYSQEIDRLGNMTLLTKSENDECGTQLFNKKKVI